MRSELVDFALGGGGFCSKFAAMAMAATMTGDETDEPLEERETGPGDSVTESPALGEKEEREPTLVELHEGAGFGRHSGDSERRLIEDDELWGKIREACPGAAGASRIAEDGRGTLAAILSFSREEGVAEAVAGLWSLRLRGVHRLTPQVASCSRDTRESIDSRVREHFVAHVLELRAGPQMAQCSAEVNSLRGQMEKNSHRRRRHRTIVDHQKLLAKYNDISFQREQILARMREFRVALESLLRGVRPPAEEEEQRGCGGAEEAFVLGGAEVGWCRLHSLLERECERVEAKLPLYGRRAEILSRVRAARVTVLVGETGSGKSTQLVQYLADAGYESVVCTQPRKVAAVALAARVREEAEGCLGSGCAVGCAASLGQTREAAGWADGITFATDFVLLHRCLTDPLLENVGCVVVDEAHERSLNTDLLLALLKSCVAKRPDLKVVIMSATADAGLLCSYFGVEEGVLTVPGRQFPVRIVYEGEKVPEDAWTVREEAKPGYTTRLIKRVVAGAGWKIREEEENGYTSKVIQKVKAIHEKEQCGSILAFLTSPSEVDWACRVNFGTSVLALPFYSKLPNEELERAFQDSPPGKRKIVFATNFAETSLTIPDVKYVVDCGLAKDSAFDAQTGMNVLSVGRIDRSSAVQRAGRAGRTQEGVCYRLYSDEEFSEMESHRLPEIKRVQLGLAILKLLALDITRPVEFDFLEAPDKESILQALRSLTQLGAVRKSVSGDPCLTLSGRRLVKLGLEPRLGKFLLDTVDQGYGQDGLVIAAVMATGRSVFYRSGSEDMKGRADSLKMRFCHPHGDFFTLLSVYQEWDSVPEWFRNRWCVNNSISSKALRKCRDQVNDMKACLKLELNLRPPCRWGWSPASPAESSAALRKIIFSTLSSNLAVYSGHPRVGYDVVSNRQEAHLHPSSAVLVYGTMPEFVVYVDLLHTSHTFLTLVTVVDREWVIPPLGRLNPAELDQTALLKWAMRLPGSSRLFARVCGKQGRNVAGLAQSIRKLHGQRCVIEQCAETETLSVFTTAAQMEDAKRLVERAVARERRWLDKECVEQPLVAADSCKQQVASPSLLLGGGGRVMDVLMPGDYAAIEVSYESASVWEASDEDEMLELFDQCGDGIFGYEKYPTPPTFAHDKDSQPNSPGNPIPEEKSDPEAKAPVQRRRRWGIVRFSSKSAARVAFQLLGRATVKRAVIHLRELTSNGNKPPFPSVKATLAWARRRRFSHATVWCHSADDKERLKHALDNNEICGSFVTTTSANLRPSAVYIAGINSSVDEKTLEGAFFRLCGVRPRFIARGRGRPPVIQPSADDVHYTLTTEIAEFVPEGKFHVTVVPPRDRDFVARAEVRFDAGAADGAARALTALEGLVLPGCKQWQAITHQRVFSASLCCSRQILAVVRDDLERMIAALQARHENTRVFVVPLKDERFHRVHVASPALAVAAGCKAAVEKLTEGMTVADDDGQETVRLLFTKRGVLLINAVETATGTLVLCDKRTRTAKIYGPPDRKAAALDQVRTGLAALHSECKHRQVALRGEGMPAGLMREIVKVYGADLRRLEEIAGAGVGVSMDHRRHLLWVEGGSLESVMRVQKAVTMAAEDLGPPREDRPEQCDCLETAAECPICFCPVEKPHLLEGCGHEFCRACLVDQIGSSLRDRDGFPLTCAQGGCSQVFLLTDIRALLTAEQQDDLVSAALSVFVAQSHGAFRYCTTPDCPNVYEVATGAGNSFVCAACSVHLCTACHVEYHEDLTCEDYREFKVDPDVSLHAWRRGKDQSVKTCPGCTTVIEKIDGCNHMLCKCGAHVCWVCLATFKESPDCYNHIRDSHGSAEDFGLWQ